MKIKLKQLVGSNTALGNLFNADIPVATGFQLGMIIEEIQSHLKRFDEMRDTLVKKYGKEQKDGAFIIPEKQVPVADKELDDLLNTEVEISTEAISISKLGEINVKPIDMYALKWLLVK